MRDTGSLRSRKSAHADGEMEMEQGFASHSAEIVGLISETFSPASVLARYWKTKLKKTNLEQKWSKLCFRKTEEDATIASTR